jgi:hypothetical protein
MVHLLPLEGYGAFTSGGANAAYAAVLAANIDWSKCSTVHLQPVEAGVVANCYTNKRLYGSGGSGVIILKWA